MDLKAGRDNFSVVDAGLSGTAESDARACPYFCCPVQNYSNGLEFSLPQSNLTECKPHARAEAPVLPAAAILFGRAKFEPRVGMPRRNPF